MPRIAVNGKLIRHYREGQGWTQMQLANRVGYSERLVRKAEAGGSVELETLDHLAEALSTSEAPLTSLDLSCEPLAVAQAFMRGYMRHGVDAVQHTAHLLHAEVVLTNHTADPRLTFGGAWSGVEGIDAMIRHAYSLYTPVREDFGRWFADGNRVSVMRNQQLRPVGSQQVITTWSLVEYEIRGGLIYRMDHYIDSAAWMKYAEHDPAAFAATDTD